MTLVPTYPLGMHVVLRGGPFRGEQGIVVDQDSREANRPKVGLYREPEANRLTRWSGPWSIVISASGR